MKSLSQSWLDTGLPNKPVPKSCQATTRFCSVTNNQTVKNLAYDAIGREFYTNRLSYARKIRIKKPALLPVLV